MEENFDNRTEELPKEIQNIVYSFDEDKDAYKECDRLLKELKPHGYIFDYGLCGEPFNIRKI